MEHPSDLIKRLRAYALGLRIRGLVDAADLLDESADSIEILARLGSEMVELAEAHKNKIANPHCGCYFKGEACCWCGETLLDGPASRQ